MYTGIHARCIGL